MRSPQASEQILANHIYRLMQDALQRADKAIAESERLIDELYIAVEKAKLLNEQLQYLRLPRIEEARAKK